MSIGIKIRNYRKKCGLTQEQVAKAVGVSKPAVSKWESSNAYPDITLLAPLARLFGTTVDSLLEYNMSLTDAEIDEKISEFSQILEYKEELNILKRHIAFYQVFKVDSKAALLFEIAEIYAKMGNTKRLIDTLNEYIEELKTINEVGNSELFYLLDIEPHKSKELTQAAFAKLAEHLSSDIFRDFKTNTDFQKIINSLKAESVSVHP